MRYLILSLCLLVSACAGVRLKNFDIESGQNEVHIAEDAAINAVCVQWFEDAKNQTTYVTKCINIHDLRKIIFPKAGVW